MIVRGGAWPYIAVYVGVKWEVPQHSQASDAVLSGTPRSEWPRSTGLCLSCESELGAVRLPGWDSRINIVLVGVASTGQQWPADHMSTSGACPRRAVREKPGEWQHCSDHSVTMLGVRVLPGPAQECYSESNRKYLQTNTSTKYSYIGSLISPIAQQKIIKMWLQHGFVNMTLNCPNVWYKTGSTKRDCTVTIGALMGGWHLKRDE